MVNQDVSQAFDRIADLLELLNEDKFRINTYRRVARLLKDLTTDVAQMAAQGKLTEIKGVGKSSAEKIEEFIKQGRISLLDELSAKVPAGLPKLLEIPGLGPKRVAQIHKELGVGSVEELKAAIAAGKLADIAGLGEASVKRIVEGLAFKEKSAGRTPLGKALPIARALADAVRDLTGVGRVEIAGSLRRGCETIGDIDLLCLGKNGPKVVTAFTKLPQVASVLASGDTKGSVVVPVGSDRDVQVDLRVVEAASFGAAWQYFTGSKEHNVRLRERAIKKGWRLNEYGLNSGEKQLAGAEEVDIYKKLGLIWVPPELREDRGELDDLGLGDRLLKLEEIKGDLHMHTTASDGKCSIEQMAEAAKAKGYAYIAITDHSKSSAIANGLSIERMWKHIETIRAADARIKGIKIFAGCECDILADGSLDYPDDVLAACDWVVASVHSAQSSTRHSPTERTLGAMENPHVRLIGHPTGRILNERAPMDLDMTRIMAKAVKTGTALEVNSSWKRLDLKDQHIRQAIAAGAMLCIDTDAHHTDQLDQMTLGVITARRGGATAENVLNTRSLAEVEKWMKKGK